MPPGWLTITQCAAAAGVSATLLRAWTTRYLWPMPHRLNKNNYRLYPKEIVSEIQHFQMMRAKGFAIEKLIEGGIYVGRLIPLENSA